MPPMSNTQPSRKSGYIKAYRSMTRKWFWPAYAHVWLDLLFLAAFKDTIVGVKGLKVPVRRGQFITSIRWLADRWGYSSSWTHQLLKRFEQHGQLRLETVALNLPRETRHDRRRSLITVLNYDHYNPRAAQTTQLGNNVLPNAVPNAVPDSQSNEVTKQASKSKSAAPVASDLTPSAPSGRGLVDPVTAELSSLYDRLRSITGRSEPWVRSHCVEFAQFVALNNLPFGWVQHHAERVARREVSKGRRPETLRYFKTALEGELAAQTFLPDSPDPRVRDLTSGIATPPPGYSPERRGGSSVPAPPKPPDPPPLYVSPSWASEEPELGEGFAAWEAMKAKLTGKGAGDGTSMDDGNHDQKGADESGVRLDRGSLDPVESDGRRDISGVVEEAADPSRDLGRTSDSGSQVEGELGQPRVSGDSGTGRESDLLPELS